MVQIRGKADSDEALNAWQVFQEHVGAKANGACVFYLKPEHVGYAKNAIELHNIRLDCRDALVSLEDRPSFERALGLINKEVSGEVFLIERSKVLQF